MKYGVFLLALEAFLFVTFSPVAIGGTTLAEKAVILSTLIATERSKCAAERRLTCPEAAELARALSALHEKGIGVGVSDLAKERAQRLANDSINKRIDGAIDTFVDSLIPIPENKYRSSFE